LKSIVERVKAGEILISDGAMGTFLQALGLKPGECPEEWCVSHPDEVRSIAQAYVDAGCDMIQTNSFGATVFKLTEFGFGDRVVEFNEAAAKIAKKAMGEKGYVAASVGPTGQILQDEGGDATEQQLYQAFKEQVTALERGGADALCIETSLSVLEMAQAVKAARENTKFPVIVTFTFEPGARGFRTMMGVDPAKAAMEAVAAGADVIGANCGTGIVKMIEITKQMRAAAPDTPILVQANAGLPALEDGMTVFKESPDDMASHVKELIDAGANIIGGCCGTTPAHIAAMAKAAKS